MKLDPTLPKWLYTIGHSNRTLEQFLKLLKLNSVSAVADVRSKPYSQRNPQFNMSELKNSLRAVGVRYAFLGDELGARRIEPECYQDGQARYDLISQLPAFRSGLDRLRKGLQSYSIVLMCAEKDPLTCHRTILVCRHLRADFNISHIVDESVTETQSEVEARLLEVTGLATRDLFRTTDELIVEAYDIQAKKIAYRVDAQDVASRGVEDVQHD